jgi:ArsR family transcriptional regulator
MDDKYANGAKVFKALCDENRLRILELLKEGERCACVILEKMEISQSTLSHHLKILCESGIVAGREDGKWTHYSLSPAGCDRAKTILADITRLSKTIKGKERCA